MRFKILFALCVSMVFSYGGAAFESDSYLIWISSRCPEQSTTCTSVTYNQTSKSNGKTIVIEGGEPIVGSLSKNLIGYTFYDLQTKHSYELSMDLDGFICFILDATLNHQLKKKLKELVIMTIKQS